MERGSIFGLRGGDLDLDATLRSGQVFRFVADTDRVWAGCVGRRQVRLWQSDDRSAVQWEADGPSGDAFIRSFLRLDDVDLPALAAGWSAADSHFGDAWDAQPGVRVLRQDPDECFFAFLCASVAPIRRIASMLSAVAREAGEPLDGGVIAFPSATQLARVPESRLRELGLGFRAARVAAAAESLSSAAPDYLARLRGASETDIRETLTAFLGVGTKIADCIALFALDRDDAVPVDTHIWRLARSRYAPSLSGRALTPANYTLAVDAYRARFGPHAGWAQQILFYRQAVGKERP